MKMDVYPYECDDCHTIFMLEENSDNSFHPCCPNPKCKSDDVRRLGTYTTVEFVEY